MAENIENKIVTQLKQDTTLEYYRNIKTKRYVGRLSNADETLFKYLNSLVLSYGIDLVVDSIAKTYSLDRTKYGSVREMMIEIANNKRYTNDREQQNSYSLQTLARSLDTLCSIFLDIKDSETKSKTFPEGTITGVKVGSLPSNTNISGKTSIEVLEEILKKEPEPTITYTCYYGYANNLKSIKSPSKSQTLVFNSTDFIKPIYKYPKSLGTLEKILDKGGSDDYTNSFDRTEEIINGVAYYVYTKKQESINNNFSYQFV